MSYADSHPDPWSGGSAAIIYQGVEMTEDVNEVHKLFCQRVEKCCSAHTAPLELLDVVLTWQDFVQTLKLNEICRMEMENWRGSLTQRFTILHDVLTKL